MSKENNIILVGEDRLVCVSHGAIYKVKPFNKNFEFDFDFGEIVKMLRQLPFSYETIPLDSDQDEPSYDENDPDRCIVEVYPEGRSSLEIFPPSFRRIKSIYLEDSPIAFRLNPKSIMDEVGAGFRCNYCPKLSSFGLRNKSNTHIMIELYKFSRQDAKRIYSFMETLKDESEEEKIRQTLEKFLRSK